MKNNIIWIIEKNNNNIVYKEIESLIKKNENLFIIDSELKYYNYFGKMLEDKGYKIRVVNYDDKLKTDGYNPLGYLCYLYNNDKIDDVTNLIKIMGKEIIGNTDDATMGYFIAMTLILLKIQKDYKESSATNFYSIKQLIEVSKEKYDDKQSYLEKYLEKINKYDPIYINLLPYLKCSTEEKEKVVQSVYGKLNNIFSDSLLVKSFSNSIFHIEFLIDGGYDKIAIFVIGNSKINMLTNILLEQCFDASNNSNCKMNFILNNFDELPIVKNIDNIINISNNKEIKLIITSKNKDKLIEKYNKKFINIEEFIDIDEVNNKFINNYQYPLPNIKNYETETFNFKNYIE